LNEVIVESISPIEPDRLS